MKPFFLVEEQEVTKNGAGPAVGLEGTLLLEITLGITAIVEQQSLDLGIHGSTDGVEWTSKPLAAFPQKFYRGIYSILFDAAKHPEIRHIRAQWKVSRWGRGDLTPRFRFYVAAGPVTAGD